MPKNLKQTKNKRTKPFIIGLNNDSMLNIETNIINSNIVLVELKPNFPPNLTTDELIKNAIKSNASNNSKNTIKLPPMGQLSIIAKNSWDKEPQDVKNFYNNLAKEARILYKQNTFQIIYDKRMNEVENDQGNGQVAPLHVTGEIFAADLGYVNSTHPKDVETMIHAQSSSNGFLTIEDSTVDDMDSCFNNGSTSISQVGTYPNHNFLEDPNDHEYKQMLVQININLFLHDLRQNYLL
ncbi:9623_t:CDS:2 [Funneliformis caledonium]|uniref:9623_t:CDS:1 n=1 Tax=Funneliformis caledonium TaxID=1117310 RepID=A0A9N9DCE6_9GLOM|nr:9623_t:CDS:2 [Funneliformis caledonium]